ncbi:MAG TPA: PilC/PilY family type IV pilus protein [Accumulibacter sp.]|uniref:pilus assembly protein n=2 Tax=Accumulibacter sp. TaxID=2053492 RepID=UPI0025FFC57F|nr:PilC/PilY family type IV pilus protein [Accumulibacter sp.]MCM8663193.1 PilC/PilY family type IV pilus protein [Accumulibacter sp.]HNC51374.1 PilC/PilY family type IV pilus protein [Accumulibacter sp.]
MKTFPLIVTTRSLFALLAIVSGAQAASTDLATAPLSGASQVQIFPNILFILDDSGSMAWDYLPDWADSNPQKNPEYRSRNAGFNGIAYNPAVLYSPPAYFTADGAVDTTSYPSQTSAATAAWSLVVDNGFDQRSAKSNLQRAAYYYTTVAGEYCTDRTLRTCTAANAASASYPFPATLRWCSSQEAAQTLSPAAGSCRATQTDGRFRYPRMPEPQTSLLTITGGGSVDSIKVNSQELLSRTASGLDAATLASDLATAINACSFGLTGNCQTVGYRASTDPAKPGVVTISAPAAFATDVTPVLVKSANISTSKFARSGSNQAPGDVMLTVITSSIPSYAYANSPARTDCSGAKDKTCTWEQEMTNYGNWWAYYHTRMQAMKTAASQSLSKIDSTRRVGYLTTNNNGGTDFLNIDDFAAAQKKAWYDKLFAALPDKDTPLRATLSRAGYLYAGKYNGQSINGVAVTDPVQYYCQKNATILSTDGYWTTGDGFKLDASTMDDEDGAEVTPTVSRPQLDGGGTQAYQTLSRILLTTTPQTQRSQKTEQSQRWYFYRTKSTFSYWISLTSEANQRKKLTQTGQLQQLTPQFTKTVTQIQQKSTNDNGRTWTPWADTDQCVATKKDATETQCQALSPASSTVSSCTSVTGYQNRPVPLSSDTASKTDIQCTALTSIWVNTAQCTDLASCHYVWPATDPQYTCPADDPSYSQSAPRRDCYTPWVVVAPGACVADSTTECSTGGTWKPDPSCPQSAEGKTCQQIWGAYQKVDSCTADVSVPPTYDCSYGYSEYQDVASCDSKLIDATREYYYCGYTRLVSDWAPFDFPDTCKATSTTDATGLITTYRCDPRTGTSQYVSDCKFVDQIADKGNDWVATHCSTETNTTAVDFCQPQDPQGCPASVPSDQCWKTTCSSSARAPTPNTLADVAQYYYMTDLRTDALHNCAPNGDASKSSVCGPPDGPDTDGQRMLTYTLGLGANGLMQYAADYQKAKAGDGTDFGSILGGVTPDPDNGICSWQTGGNCDWPPPAVNSQTNIDDLWHAAVNGRGTYFSARDPSALAAGISSALADISTAKGSLTAVTVPSPNLVAGDNNAIYEVSFEVGVWAGEVDKRTINGDTGVISANIVWSAEDQLRQKAPADRTIYTFDSANKALLPFVWASLSAQQQAYLSAPYINDLSQLCDSGVTCLKDPEKTAAGGANLLNFLRGDATYEGALDDLSKYYRTRTSADSGLHRPLGDIVGSEVVYVQAPQWNYVDKQYAEFKLAKKDRKAMLYVGANDGMLHAFAADTGNEAWAYVPALIFPRLYKLADKTYAGKHQFTVDGTPVVGDICADSAANCLSASSTDVWKTILVGGLNDGGRGYYALDITDPDHPKALWEFIDDNLGYTYGNPVISKLKDGTWVVMFASGYNNVGPGDGVGRLFILNANTGEPISSINGDGTIATSAGDRTTPSGLAKISAWANFPDVNNTAERVYGGDLFGNLWRFDINGVIPVVSDPKVYDAQRLATLQDVDGNPQPITSKPELGKVKNHPVVFVGTGRLLGPSDFKRIHDTVPKFPKDSFYAVKDPLTDTDYGNPRSVNNHFTARSLGTGSCPAGVIICVQGQAATTMPALPKNPGESDEDYQARVENTTQQAIKEAFGSGNDGWYVDFPGDGEQINTDPSLVRGSVVFTTNRPLDGGACVPKAVSFRYDLDYRTGEAIEGTSGVAGVKIADALATRAAVVVLTNDKLYGLTRTDQPAIQPAEIPTPPLPEAARRISWRELLTE